MKSQEKTVEDNARFREVLKILRENEIRKGLTPEKLRKIFEDLGPAYIKLGQILSMRTDILPDEYCKELSKLQSGVSLIMSFDEVKKVIESSFRSPLNEIFPVFDKSPLGSASIAQVHSAYLKNGNHVVVKVQREGIYETMERDISLIRRAVVLVKRTGITGDVLDFNMLLNELWATAKQEMDFKTEAQNILEFQKYNQNVAYIASPRVYQEFSTDKVMVMEYIDGLKIDDIDGLVENGYDLKEIGTKLVQNYIKQVSRDGFFHADPHPANLMIRDGKIVWLDFGMMGHLSKRDKKLIEKAISAVSSNDVSKIKDVMMTLGVCNKPVNQSKLYDDIDEIFKKYADLDLGSMDLAQVVNDVMNIAKAHDISMPAGISLLGRGMVTIEGLVSKLNPEISLIEMAVRFQSSEILNNINWKNELSKSVKNTLESEHQMLEIPMLVYNVLKTNTKGQTHLVLDVNNSSGRFKGDLENFADKILLGMIISALIIGSSIMVSASFFPKLLMIPVPSLIGFILALFLLVMSQIKDKKHRR